MARRVDQSEEGWRRIGEAFVSFAQSRKNGEICALSFLQLVFLCHGLAQILRNVLFVAVLEISLLNGISLGVGCEWRGVPGVLYLGVPRLQWQTVWLMRLFCALHLLEEGVRPMCTCRQFLPVEPRWP